MVGQPGAYDDLLPLSTWWTMRGQIINLPPPFPISIALSTSSNTIDGHNSTRCHSAAADDRKSYHAHSHFACKGTIGGLATS